MIELDLVLCIKPELVEILLAYRGGCQGDRAAVDRVEDINGRNSGARGRAATRGVERAFLVIETEQQCVRKRADCEFSLRLVVDRERAYPVVFEEGGSCQARASDRAGLARGIAR